MRHKYKSTCLCQAFSHTGCSRSILHGTNLEQSEPCFPLLRDRNYPQEYEEKEGEKINKEVFEESYPISRQQGLLEGEHPSL